MNNEAKKPIATSIYFASKHVIKIFYTCPNCKKVENRLIESNLRYCYNCGQKLDWGVITQIEGDNTELMQLKVDDRLLPENYDLQQRILDYINVLNGSNDKAEPLVCTIEQFTYIVNKIITQCKGAI